jgi:hypothetical protein
MDSTAADSAVDHSEAQRAMGRRMVLRWFQPHVQIPWPVAIGISFDTLLNALAERLL